MLIYEKKVNDERHLFGTLDSVPSDDDNQLTYEGTASLDRKYFDDGSGGIVDEDGEALRVKIGDVYVIPKDYEPEEDQVQDDDETTHTITYDANGGTGSIEPVQVTAGESVTLNDGSTLTAPEGKEFSGWAKSSKATKASVTSPYTPDKDTKLFAVWVDTTE